MPTTLASEVERRARDTYGVVPNLFSALSDYTGMPGAVYMAADEALTGGLLSPVEQQAILLDLARYYGSRYDAVVHARLALDAGLPSEAIDQLLKGELPSADPLRALVEATRASCEQRGWLDAETLGAFQSRGVSRGKLFEIFALIGMKAFTGFTLHITGVEVDDALKPTEAQLSTVPEKPADVRRQRLFIG
jgi:alkylhydroperoxidase family enzyme